MAALPEVRVRPLTADEFDTWAAHSVDSFADDLAAATGRTREAAVARAETIFAERLPDGLETPGNWLLAIVDTDGSTLGTLWIGPHPNRNGAAYVWDIAIAAEHRGRGLGRAAMLASEAVVREAGHTEIGLSVFGFNDPARRLYDSLGYDVVVTEMLKKLEPTPTTGS